MNVVRRLCRRHASTRELSELVRRTAEGCGFRCGLTADRLIMRVAMTKNTIGSCCQFAIALLRRRRCCRASRLGAGAFADRRGRVAAGAARQSQGRQDARGHQGRRCAGAGRAEAHHRNPGAALQGEGPRRILSEADAGTRLQGRLHRQRRQCDRAAQGQRRRTAEARGVGASRHGVPRRHRRDREGKGRRHRSRPASATIRAGSPRCCRWSRR